MEDTKNQARDNSEGGLLNISRHANVELLNPSKTELPRYSVATDWLTKRWSGYYLSVTSDHSRALARAGFPRKARVLFEDLTHGVKYITLMKRVVKRYHIYVPKALVNLYLNSDKVNGFVTVLEVIEEGSPEGSGEEGVEAGVNELIEGVRVEPPLSDYERAVVKAILTLMATAKGQVLGIPIKRVISMAGPGARLNHVRIARLLDKVASVFGADPSIWPKSNTTVLLDLNKLRSMPKDQLVRELIKAMRR